MPRIKPARTLEEIKAIPADKSVTIALEPEGTVVLDKEQDALEQQALDAGGNKDTKKPASDARVSTPKAGDPQDDAADLKKQLEDMRKANDENARRVQEEITARRAAEARVRQGEQDALHSRTRAEDAEYDAILNAIGAAESEAEGAQRDIATASEASDAKSVADASRRLARAEARLSQLEDGKAAVERQKAIAAARAKEPPVHQRQEQPTVDEYIEQLPNLLPSQREWLRAHPDSLTDQRKNLRLQGAHVEAEDQGYRPGTSKYFDYLETRLGYKEEPVVNDDDEDKDTPVAGMVSAPPSRTATNPGTGRPSTTRITLTPEQREIARLSGIDEITYARQLQRLQTLKSEGQYN